MKHTRIIVTHYGGPDALEAVDEDRSDPGHRGRSAAACVPDEPAPGGRGRDVDCAADVWAADIWAGGLQVGVDDRVTPRQHEADGARALQRQVQDEAGLGRKPGVELGAGDLGQELVKQDIIRVRCISRRRQH